MAAANGDEQPEPGTGRLSGLRVLVVEDSWQVATAVQSLLRSFGAEVAGPAASTMEAEQLLAERIPHVAIVDLHLRGGELAYDLIDKLNDLAVRVIVVSGYSHPRLEQDKVAAVLEKPITEAELLAAFQIFDEQS
jgi:two-component system, response regulator PdtaR